MNSSTDLSSACMFLNNLTVVDHAYIDDKGNVVGGSFNPSFLVGGKIDKVEKVVVDFSTIKKDLKKIIDNYTYGYDHKLWVIKGYSNVEIVSDKNYRTLYDPKQYYDVLGAKKPRITLRTPSTTLNLPFDAIRFIDDARDHSISEIGWSFERYVKQELRKVHGKDIDVQCFNNVDCHQLVSSDNPGSYFTYVHGLKDSTSYGCQNNSHGHLSFIQLLRRTPGEIQHSDAELLLLQQQIATELDRTIFIRKENISDETKSSITIQYETVQRGLFIAQYQKASNKIKVLKTETTIEYLAKYIGDQYGSQMKAINIECFLVSEGLSKGAFFKLP